MLQTRHQAYVSEEYGATIGENLELGEAMIHVYVDGSKKLFQGRVSLQYVRTGKYGWQLHFQGYSPFRDLNGKYARLEAFMNLPQEPNKMAEWFIHKADELIGVEADLKVGN
jgi:hypothetical protein